MNNRSIGRAIEENVFQKLLYYVYLSLMRLAATEILVLSEKSREGFSVVISAIRSILSKKNSQAREDLDEYSKYFALQEFKTNMIVVAEDIISYLLPEDHSAEHSVALKVDLLPVKDFKENSSYIQVDRDAMVIKPPSDRINNYLKMINDLENREE